MLKFMKNLDKIEISSIFDLVSNNLRGHHFKYFKEIVKHPQREFFFYNRIVNGWNALSDEIVQKF